MALLLLSSCGSVPIKDETFYVDAGSSGAVTVHFLTSGSEFIAQPKWDSLREGMYCMDAVSFGDFKKEIEELCSSTPCSYQLGQALQSLADRLLLARALAKKEIHPQ